MKPSFLSILVFTMIYLRLPLGSAQAADGFFDIYELETRFNSKISGNFNEFSDIAFSDGLNHFLILDDTCAIIEVSISEKTVTPLGETKILGLDDCEGLSVLSTNSDGSQKLAVVEERRGRLAIFDYVSDAPYINCYHDCLLHYVADVTTFFRRNSGLEGLAYERLEETDTFYLAKEQAPKKFIWES